MKLSELDYDLPPGLIAQQPASERDASRVLVVDRGADELHDATFADLPRWLAAGDCLVLNDTRVLPARINLRRQTGGRIRGLFVCQQRDGLWEILLEGTRRLKPGEELDFEPAQKAQRLHLVKHLGQGKWLAGLSTPQPAEAVLRQVGKTPLPPYIKRQTDDDRYDTEDQRRYQTVFASRPGAVAAPTAGLHFTNALLQTLQRNGVDIAYVTLHVGLGTFSPVTVDDLKDHAMHSERFMLSDTQAEVINAARRHGGRIVAVGTTSVRVLEACADESGRVTAREGETRLLIYPPYTLKAVDALLTNFHLPRSTLLALVMAFGGVQRIRRAYQHAVRRSYRFYSYGDAMLLV